ASAVPAGGGQRGGGEGGALALGADAGDPRLLPPQAGSGPEGRQDSGAGRREAFGRPGEGRGRGGGPVAALRPAAGGGQHAPGGEGRRGGRGTDRPGGRRGTPP